ncbi:MAG: pilin [Candidatus Peregrinibacteria bacterium]
MLHSIFYSIAYAQNLIPCPDGTMADPAVGCVTPIPGTVIDPGSNVLSIILNITGYLMWVAAGVAVLLLIWGAIRYSAAAGEQDQVDQAKRTLLWSVLGLAVSLLATQIVQFFLDTIK